MKEPYVEGGANHHGRGPRVCVREGAGEASVAVRAGRVIEPRNPHFGVPTPLEQAEGNIAGGAMREPSADPARSESLSTCGTSVCENREIRCPPAWLTPGRAA